jgi:hypothetical protein
MSASFSSSLDSGFALRIVARGIKEGREREREVPHVVPFSSVKNHKADIWAYF